MVMAAAERQPHATAVVDDGEHSSDSNPVQLTYAELSDKVLNHLHAHSHPDLSH